MLNPNADPAFPHIEGYESIDSTFHPQEHPGSSKENQFKRVVSSQPILSDNSLQPRSSWYCRRSHFDIRKDTPSAVQDQLYENMCPVCHAMLRHRHKEKFHFHSCCRVVRRDVESTILPSSPTRLTRGVLARLPPSGRGRFLPNQLLHQLVR